MYTEKYAHLIEQRRAALVAQLAPILPAGSELVWELGCGHGHFLTAYAAAHPEQICIGVDIIAERIGRAVRKRNRAKLANLHFIQAEARLFLDALPAEVRLKRVFVLFPDPWPKLRHNKHRIIQPSFLARVAAHATPDCPLYFRTDFTPYYEAARETIAADPLWALTDEPWPFEYATVFQQRAEQYHSLVARCKMQRTLASPKIYEREPV